jgi:hypothetical protein
MCLLLTSSTGFVDLNIQEQRMTEKNHMDQNPCISSIYSKEGIVIDNMTEPKWGRLAPPPWPPAHPSVGTISISALPTCQGESVHMLFDAQSRWRLTWVADRSCLRPTGQGLVSYHLKSMVELTQCHTPF